jgi:predicted nuclease of predicted toxin-antitoxin system
MRRVLIDECIHPRLAPRLRAALANCSVATVREMGWGGLRDHLLVPKVEGAFDVFVTIDKGFVFERNVRKLSFGIVVIESQNNQMPSYERILEELSRSIEAISRGKVALVSDLARS